MTVKRKGTRENECTGQVTDSVVSNFSLALIVAENALYQVYFYSFSVMGKAPLSVITVKKSKTYGATYKYSHAADS